MVILGSVRVRERFVRYRSLESLTDWTPPVAGLPLEQTRRWCRLPYPLVVGLVSRHSGVTIAERFIPRRRVGPIDILHEPDKHARHHAEQVIRKREGPVDHD